MSLGSRRFEEGKVPQRRRLSVFYCRRPLFIRRVARVHVGEVQLHAQTVLCRGNNVRGPKVFIAVGDGQGTNLSFRILAVVSF